MLQRCHETTHLLRQCLLAAARYGWRRRSTILWLQAILWLPVFTMIAWLPAKGSEPQKLLLQGLVEPLWIGALLHCCHADHRSKPIGTWLALLRATRSYPRLVGIRTVLEARVLLALVALIVPGLVLLARYALMDVLAICENVGPTECRLRSHTLVGKNIGSVFVVLATCEVADWALSQLVDLATESLQNPSAGVLLNTAAVTLTAVLPLTLFEFYRRTNRSATLTGPCRPNTKPSG
jgi:hypothetical protein